MQMHILKNLYKKINLFDVIVGVVILVFGITFILFFNRKSEYVNIRVKVTDQDVLYQRTEPQNWYANRFEVGDIERDALGRSITELINVERFSVDSKTQAVYVDLRVRAVFDSRTGLYTARGKSLVFGTPMRFNLSRVTFDGFVTEFPGSNIQDSLKVYDVEISALERYVEPVLAASVKKGDQIYDSNGTLLAEILEVRVTQAERVTQTDAGSLLLRYDPVYKDITVVAKVRSKTLNAETTIFDNMPLKIGEILPLNFEKVSIFPVITDFKLSTP